MRKFLFLLVVFIFLGMVLLSSCAKPPEQEMQAARDAVANAINVEANLYASDLLMLAQDSLIQAETFFGERKYADAKRLALFTKNWADSATIVAITNKEQMKTIVEAVVNDTSTKLETLKRSYQNEPDGFRGIKWGTSIDSLQGMIFQESTDGFDLYVRSQDNPMVGTVKTLVIVYYFWKDRFTAVAIHAFSYENFESLETSLIVKFGEPFKTKFFYRFWLGLKTMIMLQYDQDCDLITLKFSSPKELKEWSDIVGKKVTEGF